MRAGSRSCSTSCPITPPTGIPGSSRAAPRATIRNGTGTSGAIPRPDGGPPNNWISDFGGSAWEWDEATGQYYYHAFLKEQPDLNWRNPDVQAAMYDVMRFWFDRGVDGFRIDVLWHMVKAADFPDNPPNPAYRPAMGEMHRVLQLHSTDQPEVHAIAAEMRAIADGYGASGRGERVLIGEIYLPVDRLMHYYGRERAEVHLPFNFQLIDAPWDARALATLIADYEAALPPAAGRTGCSATMTGRASPRSVGQAQARVAAMLLLTLRGTPTLYYGDELGLSDVAIPPEQVQDPRELREPGLGLGRDPVRTPMPWDGTENAGFTTGSRGCRSMPTGRRATSRGWRRSRIRSWRCIAGCWRSGARIRRCRSATSRCSTPRATCSPMSVGTARSD